MRLKLLIFSFIFPAFPWLAMGALNSQYDGSQWAGKYKKLDPACRCRLGSGPIIVDLGFIDWIQISTSSTSDSESIQFEGKPKNPASSLFREEEYHHINGPSYIGENSCPSDGNILRLTVIGTDKKIEVISEKIRPGFLCHPTNIVEKRMKRTLAERKDGILSIWNCDFIKISPETYE